MAGFASSSGKPPVLESANRRLSETVILLLGSPTIVDLEYGTEVGGARLFGRVSELWFRILVGRTNMYEPKGVLWVLPRLWSGLESRRSLTFRDLSLQLPVRSPRRRHFGPA